MRLGEEIVSGTLWLVGTPIGNLGDLSGRMRDVLARVDVIACEDTRRTRALLSHLGVAAPKLVSYFDANEERRVPELLDLLTGGSDVALVTDAGMPAVSDPGYRLVVACIDAGVPVDVVPGPSAVVAALAVSGLPTDRFVFEGFLPRRAGQRRQRLAELAEDARTIVVYESPRRVGALVREALDVLGDRRAALVRELTKVHQEVIRDRLSDLAERLDAREIRGEIVLVLQGATEEKRVPPSSEELGSRVDELIAGGMTRKDAAARVAEDSGVSRRAAYEASLRRR